jgi:hypothetical protein
MLFLGMCLSLSPFYIISSHHEAGLGRYDIKLESRTPDRFHVVIEFKQGKGADKTKEAALEQIMANRYFTGLKGKVLCIGISHVKKTCDVLSQLIDVP